MQSRDWTEIEASLALETRTEALAAGGGELRRELSRGEEHVRTS